MGREQAPRVFVLALFALTVYLLYLVFFPFLSAIAWAVFLATAFHPLYRSLARLMKGRDLAAAVVCSGVVAAIIILPASILVSSLAQTVTGALSDIEDTLRSNDGPQPEPFPPGGTRPQARQPESRQPEAPASPDIDGTSRPDGRDLSAPPPGGESEPLRGDSAPPGGSPMPAKPKLPFVRDLEGVLGRYVDLSRVDLEGMALDTMKRVGNAMVAQTSSLVQNTLWTLVMFLITIFTMVYFFHEGPAILEAFQEFLPLRPADKEAVLERLHEVTWAVFYGVIMASVIQAILGGIGWAVVGLPSPVVAGIAMFFCSLIPVGGSFLVWGPGAVYLLLQGHPAKGIFLAVWGLAVVVLVDNFLRPLFISGRTRMHALLVFFGVLGGMMAFGVAGLFLGPLLITVLLFLLDIIRRDLFQPDQPPPGGA